MIKLTNGRMVRYLDEMLDGEFVIITLPEGGIVYDPKGNPTEYLDAGTYKVSKDEVLNGWVSSGIV